MSEEKDIDMLCEDLIRAYLHKHGNGYIRTLPYEIIEVIHEGSHVNVRVKGEKLLSENLCISYLALIAFVYASSARQ